MVLLRLPKKPQAAADTCAAAPGQPQAFRSAMRELAGGVSVITASRGDERTGLTVTSVISLSLDPPELLVSVNQNSSSWPFIKETGYFGVNVLSAELQPVAERFSGKGGIRGEQRYEGAPWQRDHHGVWVLPQALATFSCKVEDILIHHTHALVVGAVLCAHTQGQENGPLSYWRGRYGGFSL